MEQVIGLEFAYSKLHWTLRLMKVLFLCDQLSIRNKMKMQTKKYPITTADSRLPFREGYVNGTINAERKRWYLIRTCAKTL